MKITNNYYQKHKKSLRKQAGKKYQNLFEEEKHKRRKKARERCQSFTEEEKEKIVDIIVNVIKFFLRNKSRS